MYSRETVDLEKICHRIGRTTGTGPVSGFYDQVPEFRLYSMQSGTKLGHYVISTHLGKWNRKVWTVLTLA